MDLANDDTLNLRRGMQSLHERTVFPVRTRDTSNIGSTFMYRTNKTTEQSDFHRAIDIGEADGVVGDTVVAPYPGVYDNYFYLDDAGWVLRLLHTFPEEFKFKGKRIKHFYTVYTHLNNVGTKKIICDWVKNATQIVAKQPIGIMGKSGYTQDVHLHFSVRIGTKYSLQYQLTNNDIELWGFDPHIHPLMLFEPSKSGSQASIKLFSANSEAVVFLYESDRTQPILNRVETTIMDDERSIDTYVIDLNLRLGIVPSVIEKDPEETWLDRLDLDKPHFDPQDFGYQGQKPYRTKIVVPRLWLAKEDTANTLIVRVVDIWGEAVFFEHSLV